MIRRGGFLLPTLAILVVLLGNSDYFRGSLRRGMITASVAAPYVVVAGASSAVGANPADAMSISSTDSWKFTRRGWVYRLFHVYMPSAMARGHAVLVRKRVV
jgi:hypothetical protein